LLTDGSATITFGDGENGARLPTGDGNVVASYVYGAGKNTPPPNQIHTILQPQPHLATVASPLELTQGDDPEPVTVIRRDAPRRPRAVESAVSLADYEAVAAAGEGVTRAKAFREWDPERRCPVTAVYVAGEGDVIAAATTAISAATDTALQPFVLKAAQAI